MLLSFFSPVFSFFSFFFLSRALSRPERRFSFPSSLLQDRCERSWPSRSTCIPACQVSHKEDSAASVSSFQMKTSALICIAGAFIVEVPSLRSWRMPLGVSGRFGASPPASTRMGRGDTHTHTQRHRQQRQRHRTEEEEAAHRDTPRSGWRRLLHPWARRTGGRCWMDAAEDTPLICAPWSHLTASEHFGNPPQKNKQTKKKRKKEREKKRIGI